MSYQTQLRFAALAAFVLAFVMTGMGGWSNLMGKPILITEQHAWNDGLFLMLVAIFLLLLSR